jgi:hypothetical protein
MGFGLFVYYLGRGDTLVFILPIWPAFIALAFIAVKLFDYSRLCYGEWRANGYTVTGNISRLVAGMTVGIVMLMIVFFIFATGLSLFALPSTDEMKNYNAARTVVSMPSREALAVVDRYQTDNIFVLDDNSMFYLNELNLKNEYRGPAPIDFFFKQDLRDIVSQLEAFTGRVLLGSLRYGDYGIIISDDGETFGEELEKVLAERYVLIADEGGWYVYDYAGGVE